MVSDSSRLMSPGSKWLCYGEDPFQITILKCQNSGHLTTLIDYIIILGYVEIQYQKVPSTYPIVSNNPVNQAALRPATENGCRGDEAITEALSSFAALTRDLVFTFHP